MLQMIAPLLLAFAAAAAAQAPADCAMAAAPTKEPWGVLTQPLLIGHRGGACDKVPEHSLASYLSGFEHGVNVSECDVCWTADLVPICRHEPYLSQTTDALTVFPNMIRSKILDGSNITDVWVEDLTLAQIKQLRLNQKTVAPAVNRTHQYDGMFQIVTFEEHIQLVLAQDRTIGIIPELKHSTYYNSLPMFREANTTSMQEMLKVLTKYGYEGPINSPNWRKQPVWIQSFEQNDLIYVTSVSCIPVVQLINGFNSFTVDRNTPLNDLISDAGLDEIASYATVFGPSKSILAVPPADNPNGPLIDTGLTARVQNRNMLVTPYTYRPEASQMAPYFQGVYFDEFNFFLHRVGIDGIWTDSAITVQDYLSMERIVGHGWPLDLRSRLNQAPVECKRPRAADIAIARQQYPQLF